MPLAPGDGIGCIVRGNDDERTSGWPAIHVEGDGAAAVRGVEQVDGVVAGFGNLNCDVEPLAGFRPTDVKQIGGRYDLVVGVVVNLRVEFELGVRGVDAFVDAELVEVCSVGGVERT